MFIQSKDATNPMQVYLHGIRYAKPSYYTC
jgi:hypothetical protein